MKCVLTGLLSICVVGLALNCQVAQASGSRTVLAAIAAAPMPVCAAPAAGIGFAAAFPAMAPAEKHPSFPGGPDNGGFPGYAPGGDDGFACFPAEPARVASQDANDIHRDQWLASTRLAPSYPGADFPIFLPFGWHWIDFDR